MNKVKNYIIASLLGIVALMIFIMVITLYDFYWDYQCSITTDPKYFIKHNCLHYSKDS